MKHFLLGVVYGLILLALLLLWIRTYMVPLH